MERNGNVDATPSRDKALARISKAVLMSNFEKVVSRSGPPERPAVPDAPRTPLEGRKERPGTGINSAFFADIIATITDRGRDLFGLRPSRPGVGPGRADSLVDL